MTSRIAKTFGYISLHFIHLHAIGIFVLNASKWFSLFSFQYCGNIRKTKHNKQWRKLTLMIQEPIDHMHQKNSYTFKNILRKQVVAGKNFLADIKVVYHLVFCTKKIFAKKAKWSSTYPLKMIIPAKKFK